ncbi:protein translocase subunit SecD [Candidatus Dependentiae bacterium]|jgi:preprotein translocase subunit SecD|nr:protein translocase subunit SecD [Candidatus Dependentiae bacterium]
MNAQARIVKMLTTPLMAWVVVIAIGSYFMVSFDQKTIKESAHQTGILSTIKTYYNALRLTYVKKGIDLAGGTYLVLSVEIDKAIESRLGLESRSFDQFLKSNNIRELPTEKEVKGRELKLSFATEEGARACMGIVQDKKAGLLHAKRLENEITLALSGEVEQNIRTGAVEQALNVLTNRLGGYGVEGIIVQQHGDHQIVVQMPGIDDPDHVKAVITKTAHLEFKIIEDTAVSRDALLDKFDGDLPSDKVILSGKTEVVDGREVAARYYLASAFADMTGDHIVSAEVGRDEYNKPQVNFKLDSVGNREFAELTGNNIGRNLGIIIDDVVFSAPVIQSEISGGSGRISNIEGQREAFDLSVVLRSGSLLAPLKFEQESRVGASLGQDAIQAGIMSCFVAMFLLFLFGLIYYRIPGLFAVIALAVNFFLIMLFMSYFKATLTMPGIAGMVLSIGMAIDASILIFEHIKEELANGLPLRKSIANGFNGVMAVIIDSNLTTLITGIVLYQFGGPAIRGFAVTIIAGIIATLLAGIFFLKALFYFTTDVLNVSKLKF